MKTAKIITIVGLIIVFGIGSIVVLAGNSQTTAPQASEADPLGFMAEDVMPVAIMGHLKEHLNLTEEQEAQVLQILKETLQTHISETGTFRERLRQRWQSAETEHQALWEDVEKKLAEILTEEQMQEVANMREEFRGKLQGMRQTFADRSQTRGEFQQLIKDLDLTKEQKMELVSIFLKNRENRQQVMENVQEIRGQFTGLALEMLNEDFDEASVRQTYRESADRMEELVVTGAKMFAEMKAVLTTEQLELLQERGTELLQELQERPQTRHSMLNFWKRSRKANN